MAKQITPNVNFLEPKKINKKNCCSCSTGSTRGSRRQSQAGRVQPSHVAGAERAGDHGLQGGHLWALHHWARQTRPERVHLDVVQSAR